MGSKPKKQRLPPPPAPTPTLFDPLGDEDERSEVVRGGRRKGRKSTQRTTDQQLAPTGGKTLLQRLG